MRTKSAVIFFIHCVALFFWNVQPAKMQEAANQSNKRFIVQNSVKFETLNLFDKARNRSVPVALYSPVSERSNTKLKLAVFSHGYMMKNTEYSFLAETLAANGYLVASVQHESPTDEPMPTGRFTTISGTARPPDKSLR